MERIAVLAVCLIACAGCGGGEGEAEQGVGVTNLATLAADDPHIAAAQEEAQRRWPEFERAFREAEPNDAFTVKVAYPTTDGSREHLWLGVTAVYRNTVAGEIANEPVGDIGHELGDPVEVERTEIEDWAVYRDGELVKGYFSEEAVEGGDE